VRSHRLPVSTPVFTWAAGRFSGVTGTRDRALEVAAAVLGAGVTAVVREARFVITAAPGSGGLVPGYEPTGLAWTGRLRGGEPVWERAPAPVP
jgi:hypothetical protein